nr:uncharacterized protein CI109_007453 [Kwoniella shandongensis]KAA5524213.1 hypothetical protein CI109_007453 [Kwoniella shandongensis]
MISTHSQPPSPHLSRDPRPHHSHSHSNPHSALPSPRQKKSNPTTPSLTNILMPTAENVDDERERERERERGPAAPASQAEKRDVGSSSSGTGGGKGWVEGVDYAYEYVPVSQW